MNESGICLCNLQNLFKAKHLTMKKTFYLFLLLFLLNGCVESVALLGSTAGGASSGKLIQSSLQSTISYGIKKQTGKTPLGHALAYAEKHNPEKKKETCISFIEKTKSEFCTIAKKQISLTNNAIKEKVLTVVRKASKTEDSVNTLMETKDENNPISKDLNFVSSFDKLKKSPRELAIALQAELKETAKRLEKYLVSR